MLALSFLCFVSPLLVFGPITCPIRLTQSTCARVRTNELLLLFRLDCGVDILR